MVETLEQLENKITPYLYKELQNRIATLPSLKLQLIKEAMVMSDIGINSEEDHKSFFHILRYNNTVAKKISSYNFSLEELAKLSHIIYINRQKFPIDTIFNFHKAAESALNKMKIPIKKLAYPQGDTTPNIENQYDIQKWMQSMREIYALAQHLNIDISKAFDQVTTNWDKMEKKDFKSWMSFYEENAHNKYKIAQQNKYYEAGPGAMIPLDHLRSKLPNAPNMQQFDKTDTIDQAAKHQIELDKKESVKRKIRAIISRLNAAERLATDPEVQRDLQQCLDIGIPKWLEELQRVKRLVQLAPMRSTSSSILEDLIIKQSNILINKGFPKAAKELRTFAQIPPVSPEGMDTPSNPMTPEGSSSSDGDKALDELVENMNSEDSNDINAIEDVEDDPLASITVMAQAIEPNQDLPSDQPASNPMESKPTLEVEEPASMPEKLEPDKNIINQKTDDLFEAALANIGIDDIINRLEAIANIFRTREISRQLALIDLMLNRLNLSTFFPSLAEASSKTLESNQYALTRIEEIISKLRGSVDTPKNQEIDLIGRQQTPSSPIINTNPEQIRENLNKQDALSKMKKERRQAEEDAKATQAIKSQPEEVTNVPEELAQPTQIMTPPKPQVR